MTGGSGANVHRSPVPPSGGAQYTQSLSGTVGFTGSSHVGVLALKIATLAFVGARTSRVTKLVGPGTLAFVGSRTVRAVRSPITAVLGFTSDTVHAIIPLYIYPASGAATVGWADVIANRPQMIIVNPATGPGTSLDTNYQAAINAVRAAGIKVLGYVNTALGTRAMGTNSDTAASNTVKGDVNGWPVLYPVDGYFFDTTPTDAGANLTYMQTAAAYGRSVVSGATIVFNPGAYPLVRDYLDAADVTITFEGDYTVNGYASYTVPSYASAYDPLIDASHKAHLVYGVADSATMLSAVAVSRSAGVGYFYASSSDGAWGTFPTYWQNEFGVLTTTALIRRTSDVRSGVVGFTSRSSVGVGRSISAALGLTSSITRQITHGLSAAALGFVGALTRRTTRAIAGTLGFTGSVTSAAVHHFTQLLTAALSFTTTTPTLRAVATPVSSNTAVSTINLTVPTGVVTTDLGFIEVAWAVSASNETLSVTAPGWTRIDNQTTAANNMGYAVLKRNGGQVATDTITITLGGLRLMSVTGQWWNAQGRDPDVIGSVGTRGGVSQATNTLPAITTLADGELVLVFSSERTTATGTTITGWSPTTPVQDQYYEEAGGFSACSFFAGHFTQSAQGSTGTDTVTYKDASGNAAGMLLSIPARTTTTRTSTTRTATLGPTATLARAIRSNLAAALGLTGSQIRRVATDIPGATLGLTGGLSRRVGHVIAGSISFTASVTTQAVHFFTQSFTATLGFTSAQVRSIGHTIGATLGLTGAQTRRVTTQRVATVGLTGSQRTSTSTHLVQAALSFTGAQTRRVGARLITGALGLTGSLTSTTHHFFTQALNATLGLNGALVTQRLVSKVLTATVGATGSLTRSTNHAFAATISWTSTIVNGARVRLTATLGLTTSFTIVPHLVNALGKIKIRISGREGRTTSAGTEGLPYAQGREGVTNVDGKEPGTQ